MFKLEDVLSFTLNKHFWILGSSLPKKGISTNGGQIESKFAQGYPIPSVTYTVFIRLHDTITILISLFSKVAKAINPQPFYNMNKLIILPVRYFKLPSKIWAYQAIK